jgi:hypothetical protein
LILQGARQPSRWQRSDRFDQNKKIKISAITLTANFTCIFFLHFLIWLYIQADGYIVIIRVPEERLQTVAGWSKQAN